MNNGVFNTDPERAAGATGQGRFVGCSFVQLMFLLRWWCLGGG